MFFSFPLAFAQHLNAGTVDQSLQATHAFLYLDDDLKVFFCRQIVLESGTFQATLASRSKLSTQPVVWRSVRFNRLLIVKSKIEWPHR